MTQLKPMTAEQERFLGTRRREEAAFILPTLIEKLHAHFVTRREVEWNTFNKVVRQLITLGAHRKPNTENSSFLERVLVDSSTSSGTVHVEGNKIYIEGYFDITKLQQRMLW